jgi:hypothetical protein
MPDRIHRFLIMPVCMGILFFQTHPLAQVKGANSMIPLVKSMPNLPTPYHMRDWKKVTKDYLNLIFDFNRKGEMLPLVKWRDSGHDSFILPSYVGLSGGSEAINCMAAVVSGDLNGIDMTHFQEQNWVRLSQLFYSPIDKVYVNGIRGRVAGSFWYDLLPNILFYQIASRYPDAGDSQIQFQTVADQWCKACTNMGGDYETHHVPNLDHTAFQFEDMKPVNNGRWIEPDGGAGIAWIEYMAWLRYHNPKYLQASELCLEALESRPVDRNPLYECLLPYGALTAVRLNAEQDKHLDTRKLINWCFNAGGADSARIGWGVISTRFGEDDCAGLAGSVTDTNGYAFAMNTFEWAGALTPVARYDTRYAHDIGKWMLNLSNAARLFYPNSLPASHQDCREWADINDPNYCIGYEGLRKEAWFKGESPNPSISPFATGDALRSGNPSNLCLYGSSHAGILGAIVERSNVDDILILNLLKTDYYHAPAYPSYLIYNPYSESKRVRLDIGPNTSNIYDAVSHIFIARNVRNSVTITISADTAQVLVITSVPEKIVIKENKMYDNGIIVDYGYKRPE